MRAICACVIIFFFSLTGICFADSEGAGQCQKKIKQYRFKAQQYCSEYEKYADKLESEDLSHKEKAKTAFKRDEAKESCDYYRNALSEWEQKCSEMDEDESSQEEDEPEGNLKTKKKVMRTRTMKS